MEIKMKYVVILGDGMADRPLKDFNDKTPLELAHKPNIDRLAKLGEVGMVKTVADGFKPGSDVCNLAVMGYNPNLYYKGRSCIEAVSMGISLTEADTTYRCNLVTLSNEENYEDKTMVDYSAGEITTEEAKLIISDLKKYFDNDEFCLYNGISYRHCLVCKTGNASADLTPPHDISGRKITEYLPKNDDRLLNMMKKSYEILKNHPVNLKRIAEGKNPANSIWLWGMGTKPALPDFYEKNHVKGAVISAVDLVKGIGILANMENISVPGATGDLDSNFDGKAEYALKALKNNDFVYVHMEAPDECGHRGQAENKKLAIELIDKHVVGKIIDGLEKEKIDYTIMVLPDHPTPIEIKTHAKEPVPYLLYSNVKNNCTHSNSYSEKEGQKTGIYVDKGYELIDKMLNYAK